MTVSNEIKPITTEKTRSWIFNYKILHRCFLWLVVYVTYFQFPRYIARPHSPLYINISKQNEYPSITNVIPKHYSHFDYLMHNESYYIIFGTTFILDLIFFLIAVFLKNTWNVASFIGFLSITGEKSLRFLLVRFTSVFF